MLPADTSGKTNYSPGTLRPVRKFGSRAGRHGRNQRAGFHCGLVIGDWRFVIGDCRQVAA